MFGFVLFYRFFYTLKREKLNCIQSKRSFDFNNEIDFRDSRNFCSLNWNQTFEQRRRRLGVLGRFRITKIQFPTTWKKAWNCAWSCDNWFCVAKFKSLREKQLTYIVGVERMRCNFYLNFEKCVRKTLQWMRWHKTYKIRKVIKMKQSISMERVLW